MTRFRLILTGVCIAITLLAGREYSLLPNGKLWLHAFDIGQGDAMLLVTPSGKQIVVDGGPNVSLLESLGTTMPFADRTIDLVILSHPDADHVTALPEMFRRYDVAAVLLSGTIQGSGRYEALLDAIDQNGSTVIFSDPDVDISMGDGVMIDVLWPPADTFGSLQKEPNDASVVAQVRYGTSSILLTGDIGERAEAGILATGKDIRSTILKVPHHGSRSSSSTGFLLAVDPVLAVISAGRENSYGHPHSDVVQRYASFGIPLRSTATEGTISLSFGS